MKESCFLVSSERSGSNFITKIMDAHQDFCGPSPTHIIRTLLHPVAQDSVASLTTTVLYALDSVENLIGKFSNLGMSSVLTNFNHQNQTLPPYQHK